MAKAKRHKSSAQEYIEALVVAGVLTLFLRQFVLQAFRIPSESMLNTLLVGDFLFVNKLEYGPKLPFTHIRLPGLRSPRRGDVIVFQFPQDPTKDFIKRCIGTGGETLQVRDKVVSIKIGTLLADRRISRHTVTPSRSGNIQSRRMSE